MSKYLIGLDLGQSQDFTALAILERVVSEPEHVPAPERKRPYYGPTSYKLIGNTVGGSGEPPKAVLPSVPSLYSCVHLERYELGTRYPAIVDAVDAMMKQPELRGQCELVIDATGVGRPVCDLFKDKGIHYTGVTITGGDSISRDGALFRVPKRILVSTLQVLLQGERLKVAPNPLRETLVRELLAFQVTVTEAANDTYGGRTGTHDDLVLAVALAAWKAERPIPAPTPVSQPAGRRYYN